MTRQRGDSESGSAPGARVSRSPDQKDHFPSIGLDRLDASRGKATVGARDLFDFGREQPSAAPPAPRPDPGGDRPPPPPRPTSAVVSPPSTQSEPARVTYIGSLRSRRGLEVAVLMTDDEEVLTGRVGEMIANRFRIVEIGIESVDIQDVGSERVRRIPLKGN
jgi:hypothetical protein